MISPDPTPAPAQSGGPPLIGVIVNPHARHARDPHVGERLRQVARAAGVEGRCRVVVTPDLAALGRAMAEFARSGVSVVATCGGDGTTMRAATEMVRAFPPGRLPRLLLLRGGTVNTIARNLRIRGRPEALLARALGLLAGEGRPPWPAGPAPPVSPVSEDQAQVWEQDLIRVRSRGPHGQRAEDRYGCLFAAAMGARFLETYYGQPRQGLATAGALVLRTIGSMMVPGGGRLARHLFAEQPATVHVDGQAVPEGRFRLLLAATVADVGLGMRVTWQAGSSPGRFHVVASRLPLSAMMRQLPRVLAGAPLSGPSHTDRLAESLALRFPAPQPYTLDGDLFSATEVEVDIGPRLSILRT